MIAGILPLDKPTGVTSFHMVARLRKLSSVQKIGHSGTLDPFASGVLILLIGRQYTKMSDLFLNEEKQYLATVYLGEKSDTYDPEGIKEFVSSSVPTKEEIDRVLEKFQGEISQIPPMFSAKKVGGKKLYEIARKGITIERKPCLVKVKTTLVSYTYPLLQIHVTCSKGTYIRSIAHDMGEMLGTGAYLKELVRTKSGGFSLSDCAKLEDLSKENLHNFLVQPPCV